MYMNSFRTLDVHFYLFQSFLYEIFTQSIHSSSKIDHSILVADWVEFILTTLRKTLHQKFWLICIKLHALHYMQIYDWVAA